MSDRARKSDLVDIACEIRRDRPDEKSIAVADGTRIVVAGHDREKWFWLPRSQIEVNGDGTVTMPEWLALEKGLI
jgi:hypothetical protein